MIAVDTSALMAIVLDEPQAAACIDAIEVEERVLISAGTMVESLIVAARRNVRDEVAGLIMGLGFEVVPVTSISAPEIGDAYERCGRGSSAAGLNFGDCFAYQVARAHGCRLLYVGEDFARTDIEGVLSPR
ncbi:type II toxin-antitoxin system VapC family toxin [Rhodopseudomonas palustris]|nr:type II toxin-antitoxin system VapC family toxin [Rhodopseudomonas palustris]